MGHMIRIVVTAVAGFILAVILLFLFVALCQTIGLPDWIFILGAFGLLFGTPIALCLYVEKRGIRKRTKAAESLGFTFLEDYEDELLRNTLSMFPTFANRGGTAIRNIFKTSVDGVDVSIFDYSYATFPKIPWWLWFFVFVRGLPFCPAIRNQTIVLIKSWGFIFPQFFLRLRSELRKWDYAELNISNEVPTSVEFSRKYCLRGADPDRIREIFSKEVMSYYMQHKGLHTETWGEMILV